MAQGRGMAWHTLAQAIELTGRSRRSIYRDMNAGRVSYRVRDDGRRELETSELLRSYGPLRAVAQPQAQEVAQVGTAAGTPDLTELLTELRLLRGEVAELRQTMLLLEHRPHQEQPAPVDSFLDDCGALLASIRQRH